MVSCAKAGCTLDVRFEGLARRDENTCDDRECRSILEKWELEAAVIGDPNDRWGEVGLAVLALKPGTSLDRSRVIEHCVAKLAKFKVPNDIAIVEALPRNATGKVLKRELRTEFVGEDGPKIS